MLGPFTTAAENGDWPARGVREMVAREWSAQRCGLAREGMETIGPRMGRIVDLAADPGRRIVSRTDRGKPPDDVGGTLEDDASTRGQAVGEMS